MNENVQCNITHQQLLRDLKCTIESLLISQVANVWNVYGALNRLYNVVEKIFRHGCSGQKDVNFSYWEFVEGLNWLQPDSSSVLNIDAEYKPHLPQHLKSDKASIWLFRSLENHSLSQKLSWLLSDKNHLENCYLENAFLRQPKYSESVLICLRAVERNQPSLMSEIDPCLFLTKPIIKKVHRRCSSYPDTKFQVDVKSAVVTSKSEYNLETHHEILSITKPHNVPVYGKLKPWSSMPNLRIEPKKIRERSKTMIIRSSTTPSSPCYHLSQQKLSPSILKVDYSTLKQNSQKMKLLKKIAFAKTPKRVIIHNLDIEEHTPPLSSSQSSGTLIQDNFATLSTKSCPPESIASTSKYTLSLVSSVPSDYGLLTSKLGHKDYKKHPKKSFIEDGGSSVLPMFTGYFPKPTKGQSLSSFLTSRQFTRANAELDRENAHFSISEAIIAAIEQLKCKRQMKIDQDDQEESDEEIMNLKQRIRMRRKQKQEEKQRNMWATSLLSDGKTDTTTTEASVSPLSTSPESPSDSEVSMSDSIQDLNMDLDMSSNLMDQRGMSLSMASLYSDADLGRKVRGAPDGQSDILSAEGVALSLISKFNEKQLPRASDLEWLVSEEEVPQMLLPLPKSWPVSPDDCPSPPEDTVPSTPLRGTYEWAPPRPQIIFTPHPSPKRKVLMAKQNYRCAGCGMRVASKYASTFRYCDYLGRYFCTGCHTNQLSLIPGRVLHDWNFSRYPVSTFSYRLLEQMYCDPIFRAAELNKSLTKRSRLFDNCRKLRFGLYYLKDFILMCRFAEILKERLQKEPSYMLYDPEIYSMQDLFQIKSGELIPRLKMIVEMCCRHTSECQLCLGRGFMCEICDDPKIIFPWQIRRVNRCDKCGACFHIACWNPKHKPCVKCKRIATRKESVTFAEGQMQYSRQQTNNCVNQTSRTNGK